MEEQRKRGKPLVLIASPFQGHMTPMLQLGTVLHSRGFSITIAHTKLNAPDPSKHRNFKFLPLSDNFLAIDASANYTKFIEALNENCKTQLQDHLARMINETNSTNNEKITIIHDSNLYFPDEVASNLKLPSIVLRSCSASYMPAYLAIPRLHAQGQLPMQDYMLQELVPELHPLRYKDFPFNTTPKDIAIQMFAMTHRIKNPSAIIWNTIEFLEHSALSQLQQHYQVPIYAVGPLNEMAPGPSTSFLEEDTSCISWLDNQAPKSVIYVSLGSLATMGKKELAEMAWGLANSKQPFLWVVRPGSVCGSSWIEFLPEGFAEETSSRGLILKWAPQKQVLAHSAVGGFWSHCGWNSTLESISVGVPMICQPFLGDQGVNARYLSYVWRVGLELECIEREAIKSVIRRLLVDKEGEEVRHRAMDMKEKVKDSLCKDGSSFNSLNDLVEFILSN